MMKTYIQVKVIRVDEISGSTRKLLRLIIKLTLTDTGKSENQKYQIRYLRHYSTLFYYLKSTSRHYSDIQSPNFLPINS